MMHGAAPGGAGFGRGRQMGIEGRGMASHVGDGRAGVSRLWKHESAEVRCGTPAGRKSRNAAGREALEQTPHGVRLRAAQPRAGPRLAASDSLASHSSFPSSRQGEGGALDPKTSMAGVKAAAEAAAAAAAAADGGMLSARLPAGALVVVAGASTPLGARVLRAVNGCGAGWRLRALVAEGTELDKRVAQAIPEIECTPLAPFAPTALAKSLSGADALVVISTGAGGGGMDSAASVLE